MITLLGAGFEVIDTSIDDLTDTFTDKAADMSAELALNRVHRSQMTFLTDFYELKSHVEVYSDKVKLGSVYISWLFLQGMVDLLYKAAFV